MATNPMQRKTRNAFLLGALISMVICLLIGVLLYLLLNAGNQKRQKVTVYVLTQDYKAGDQITASSLSPMTLYADMIPSNYMDTTTLTQLYANKDVEKEPIVAAIDLKKNAVLTRSAVIETEVTDDTRYVEYNMLSLYTEAAVGDFVDIRITFPNGQDLIVVSKRRIEKINGTAVGFRMTEGEISMMESAIVESYIMTASKLYVSKYISSVQEMAEKTYVPTQAVQTLIAGNPNIEKEARDALAARFDVNLRSWEERSREAYAETEKDNLEAGVLQDIENARKAREEYLAGVSQAAALSAAATTTTGR